MVCGEETDERSANVKCASLCVGLYQGIIAKPALCKHTFVWACKLFKALPHFRTSYAVRYQDGVAKQQPQSQNMTTFRNEYCRTPTRTQTHAQTRVPHLR
eukprot:m.370125 g.370125  ORF g.370125 m.370125 type:complete len:100 (+) comp52384_c0_seq1:91-390(+)